jgi:hypothetical protein
MPLAVAGEKFSDGIEMRVLANAGENIDDLAAVRGRILDAVRSEKRQMITVRQIDQPTIDLFFAADEVPLKFNENIFAAESIDKKLRAISKILGSARALACSVRRLAERFRSINYQLSTINRAQRALPSASRLRTNRKSKIENRKFDHTRLRAR